MASAETIIKQAERKQETRDQRFYRLMPPRVNKTAENIRQVAKLSNKASYEYTDEQVEQVFSFLQEELNQAKKAFETFKPEEKTFTMKPYAECGK